MEIVTHLRLAKKALSDRLISLGYSPTMASELSSGKRKPSIKTAAAIEGQLGIPAAVWAARVPLQEMWEIVVREANNG